MPTFFQMQGYRGLEQPSELTLTTPGSSMSCSPGLKRSRGLPQLCMMPTSPPACQRRTLSTSPWTKIRSAHLWEAAARDLICNLAPSLLACGESLNGLLTYTLSPTPHPCHRRVSYVTPDSPLLWATFTPLCSIPASLFVLAAKPKMDSISILLPKCWSKWQPAGLGTLGADRQLSWMTGLGSNHIFVLWLQPSILG